MEKHICHVAAARHAPLCCAAADLGCASAWEFMSDVRTQTTGTKDMNDFSAKEMSSKEMSVRYIFLTALNASKYQPRTSVLTTSSKAGEGKRESPSGALATSCDVVHAAVSVDVVRRVRGPPLAGFQRGSGQTGLLQKGHKSYVFCNIYFRVRTFCRKYYTFSHTFAMKVDYGDLRRFCDDPRSSRPRAEAVNFGARRPGGRATEAGEPCRPGALARRAAGRGLEAASLRVFFKSGK